MRRPTASRTKTAAGPATSALTPSAALRGFLAKYDIPLAAHARAVVRAVRDQIPPAVEMVYDNYNALVIGFGPSVRPSEAVLSVAVFPRHVSLCFLQGATLPDPDRLLQGSGNVVRHIRVPALDTLRTPQVRALIASAVRLADPPFSAGTTRQLIIRSVSAAQRPRRPAPVRARRRA
jgi:hypothetical protein